MAEITAISPQSFARVQLTSLNSPPTDATLLSMAFRPALDAQRRLIITGLLGLETFEVTLELRDEVFEAETLRGEAKRREGE